MATDYIAAIALIVVGVLKTFGILVAPDAITGIITGVFAIYIAFKRHQQGDITAFGVVR